MRRHVATLAPVALVLLLLAPVASVAAASPIQVRPGQSIQDAIDVAPTGGTIYVAPGIYPGNLEVVRSVHLVGDHATLVPAAVPTDNLCLMPGAFDGVTGICVHGAIDFETGAITPVADVSIEGLTIRGFGGPGIVALAVAGFRATGDVTAFNGEMGMFINMVSNLSVQDNRSYGNHGDGIFLENLPGWSPSADAVITGNASYGNLGSGIAWANSLGGRIADNDLTGNCAGILVFAFLGEYGPGASGDLSIQDNRVTANNGWCPADGSGAPAYGGIGIALAGTRNTTVERNDVRGNRAQAGSAIHGGGIVILTVAEVPGVSPGSTTPTGNSVSLNRLSGNSAYDIYGDGSGSSNTVSDNTCRTTNLGGC
jgi:nitrous oxidase accessory protein NosD